MSVPHKCTLIPHFPSKTVHNLHIVLVFATPFLILFFWFYHIICVFLFVSIILLLTLVSCLSMCHHSAQLHFLLKSLLHCHLIFLSHGHVHLFWFSKYDFCFVCMFSHSQSSEYDFIDVLFLVLLQVPIFHLLTFSLLPHFLCVLIIILALFLLIFPSAFFELIIINCFDLKVA